VTDKSKPDQQVLFAGGLRSLRVIGRAVEVCWLSDTEDNPMATTKKLLAFDLGAESGRGLLGLFDGGRLRLEVLHRFPNGPVRTLDTLHWDVLRLYGEMVATLRLAARDHGGVDGLGVDTWGVDFALLGKDGTLLGNPRHYRDPHTATIMEETFARVPRAEIFRHTGIQFMRFNTLFQLLALRRDGSPLLDAADTMLLMADLFHYFFTGVKAVEFTNASTTQMLDPRPRTWARDLVERCELPAHILGPIVAPGTVLGPLRSSVMAETGLAAVPVIAPATHDTGAAVAAVPAATPHYAYISSGTWSLMGAEVSAPLLTEQTQAYNFTNEGGVGGTIRLLKNIMGLWLVQECRRAWQRDGRDYSYDALARLAEAAPPFVSLVNPDDTAFILPADMPAALAEFCRRTGQPEPREPGPVVRCALESLALRYRWVLEKLEELLGRRLEVIHVVGGGSQNAVLCQFTADACDRPVQAGPVEATALGNVLVQALGLGLVGSLAEGRDLVRRSFDVITYTPRHPDRWHEPYRRFLGLI
jgi:rhamnulokinase